MLPFRQVSTIFNKLQQNKTPAIELMKEKTPIIRMQNMSKTFGGVYALRNVDIDIYPGEVHALVGENGAGKSTLIKILAGVHHPSQGEITLEGKAVSFPDPSSAQHAGVSVIFQEFNLIPDLSVAENIYLNREPINGIRIDWAEMYRGAEEALDLLNVKIDPHALVGDLSVAHQQLVEIARALAFKSPVIVMDEPTAAISDREVEQLLKIVKSLAESGVAIIYISHRMSEIFTISNKVTVLRDGDLIFTKNREEVTENQIISAMVGRQLVHVECPPRNPGEKLLSVRDLSVDGLVADVSFDLHAGEVLALTGLIGSGCSDVMGALFGLQNKTSGEIELNGKQVVINGPSTAIGLGLGYVPDDRKRDGILPDLSVTHNISIGLLDRLRRFFLIRTAEENNLVNKYQELLDIKFSHQGQLIGNLSGGNQQKVILARALAEECQVLLLLEPTRGVDVGAKVEIYALIDELVEQGMAVLVQSSELPEIIRLANRCIVFAAGRPQGELQGSKLDQENLMTLATGADASHLGKS